MGNMLRALRIVILVEAVSYLVLLGIAMPLKHFYGRPMAVRVFGMAHGLLFLVMLWLLARAHFEAKWGRRRIGMIVLASLLPLWPFALDRRVKQWVYESATRGGSPATPNAP